MSARWKADLKTLQLVLAAADEGSISRGAARLHLALGAASRRIADFETRVGFAVFERHARGVALSGRGRLLLGQLRPALEGVDRVADAIEDIRTGVVEHLWLLACDSAINQFLPGVLRDFVAENPGVRIELAERPSTEIVQAVTDRRGNLGIIWSDVDTRELVTRRFREDELALVVPTAHPFAARRSVRFIEALAHDFVTLDTESPVYVSLRREAAKLDRVLRARIQVRGFDALCRMVEAGLGIGVVPRSAAADFASARRIARVGLREPWARRNISVVYRRVDELAPVERRFLAFCQTRA